MVHRDVPGLSLSRQCEILSISRSALYYVPKGESPANLGLMRRIDELFLKYPFYGSRQMTRQLRREGIFVGRHRVQRLMRLMGLEAIYQAPRTSQPHPEHRVYPYRLKGLAIEQPDHVWCADITYIPVRRGPEIFNTDQGSQFTSFDFTGRLKDAGVTISMDGRGRCMDNIFIERLWRSLKYEAVHLVDLTDGFHAERVIADWIGFYNTERPHSALGGQTPAEAYAGQPVDMMDKAIALPTSPQAQQQQGNLLNRFLAA